jgi:lambda repressor-like predicted transcriptional regulator
MISDFVLCGDISPVEDHQRESEKEEHHEDVVEELEESGQEQLVNVSRSGMLTESTERSYNSFRRLFANFCGVEFNPEYFLPKDIYTDANVSNFVRKMGEERFFGEFS